MANRTLFIKKIAKKLLKGLHHLRFSFKKVENLTTDLDLLTEEELADWEGFTARFSRMVDLYLTQFVRAKALAADPGFSGTLVDIANIGEKLGLIHLAEDWLEMRGIRNAISHEYEDEVLAKLFERTRALVPFVFATQASLEMEAKE